jgi:hypothetical protein
LDLEQIGKLRHDANLRWLYKGKQKPCGRPKCYDGKVNFDDLSRFELVDEIDSVKLYTAIIDLLSIDVEGAEMEVLKGLDFEVYKPKLILLEDKYLYLKKHLYLKKKGYALVRRLNRNCWYIPIH